MAYVLNYQSLTLLADSTVSAATTPIFVITTDGTSCNMPDGTNNIAGIAVSVPPLASACEVAYAGVCKVTCDSSYVVGTILKGATGTGLATLALDTSGVNGLARAIALEAATTSGDIITVRLIDAIGAPKAQ